MFYIDKLKEKITEVQTGLTAALAYIESPEYRAQCEANYGKSVDMYPSMLGYLKAEASISAASGLSHAAWLVEQSALDIAWGERCAALCESLGIDSDNIAELETLMAGDRYRSDARYLREKITEQAGEVRDDARAREHDQALNALTDAGFDPDDDDDDILTCCSWRVQIETKRKNGDFWYEFTLESNGAETLRGKSGEFAALLAAVGISQQEVKS